MKIYIGCPIQGFTNDSWKKHWQELEKLKDDLRKRGHEILDFKGNLNQKFEPDEVFANDYKQCMSCDAMIAIALSPSTGMGMEIGICLKRTRNLDGEPSTVFVFGTAPIDTDVSKMVIGCNLSNFVFERHNTFDDIPEMFEKSYKKYQV